MNERLQFLTTSLTERDRRYSSHLEVLRSYTSAYRRPAIEFGAGRFSTPLLFERCFPFTSYESTASWRAAIADEIPGVDIRPTPPTVDELCQLIVNETHPDHLVFVDGSPAIWRANVLLAVLSAGVAIALAHDWPQNSYGYDTVKTPDIYRLYVYQHQQAKVRTAVFLRRDTWPEELPLVADHRMEKDRCSPA